MGGNAAVHSRCPGKWLKRKFVFFSKLIDGSTSIEMAIFGQKELADSNELISDAVRWGVDDGSNWSRCWWDSGLEWQKASLESDKTASGKTGPAQ